MRIAKRRPIRSLGPRQAVYSYVDTIPHMAQRHMGCPTCQKPWAKGDTVYRATFVHEPDGFILRHKLYCSETCVPNELRSK